MGRLVVAGQAWDTGAGAFVGGKVVRLETDGSWTEIHDPAVTGAWYLREYLDATNVPRLFYISSPGGVSDRPWRGNLYRSIDEGDTWADVSPPLGYVTGVSHGAGDRLWCITDMRQDPSDMGAVSPGSRIYYSDDWGNTWNLSYTIPESYAGRSYPLYNIAAHPNDANKIVVEGVYMANWQTRMWRTTDGGSSWSAAFYPTFPTSVFNGEGKFSLSLTYASDGSLIYITRVVTGSGTFWMFRSTDDGANFSTYYSDAGGFANNDGMYFLEACPAGYLWFISQAKIYRAPDWLTAPTAYGEINIAPFGPAEDFRGITCHDGTNLNLGVYDPAPASGCCDPPGIYARPIDLSTGWVKHPSWDAMDSDLGYRVYPWASGVTGATVAGPPPPPPPDRYEVPCDTPFAAGDINPQCIPILTWEISVDGKNFFTRSRAQGMGINNPGQAYMAELEDPYVWAPVSAEYGEEGGSYNVRRELIINDYGINEAEELSTLAGAYLTTPEKKWKGITTIKFTIGGMPRAGTTAPTPNKILQAGDTIEFGCGSDIWCGIAEGDWIVDEVHYSSPKGITTIIASRRPAAQAVRTRGGPGNIRNLGETIANEFGVWESPWFSVQDTEFYMNVNVHNADRFYSTFKMEHYMGVVPRIYLMIAAKQKIYDWYDSAKVIAAQPLYVPRQFLDIAQVQGVGYNIVAEDDIQVVFHLWRYLFYDSLDGRWVPPEDRFLKIWLIA